MEVPVSNEQPIAYSVLPLGTPVTSTSGTTIGKVEHVLQDPSLDLFDGIAITTSKGLRFVEANQISLITASLVETTLDDEAAAALPEPDGEPIYSVNALRDVGDKLTARLGRLFRREHWKLDK
jgi:hypothetical protein